MNLYILWLLPGAILGSLCLMSCYQDKRIFYLAYILRKSYVLLELCTRINFVLILSSITIAHIHWKFFIHGIPSCEILAPPLPAAPTALPSRSHEVTSSSSSPTPWWTSLCRLPPSTPHAPLPPLPSLPLSSRRWRGRSTRCMRGEAGRHLIPCGRVRPPPAALSVCVRDEAVPTPVRASSSNGGLTLLQRTTLLQIWSSASCGERTTLQQRRPLRIRSSVGRGSAPPPATPAATDLARRGPRRCSSSSPD